MVPNDNEFHGVEGPFETNVSRCSTVALGSRIAGEGHAAVTEPFGIEENTSGSKNSTNSMASQSIGCFARDGVNANAMVR